MGTAHAHHLHDGEFVSAGLAPVPEGVKQYGFESDDGKGDRTPTITFTSSQEDVLQRNAQFSFIGYSKQCL